MDKHIRCKECRFARPDPSANERRWKAIECGNNDSEDFKALLNVTPSGAKLPEVSWRGCVRGERRDG